jgi:hypothetical protein
LYVQTDTNYKWLQDDWLLAGASYSFETFAMYSVYKAARKVYKYGYFREIFLKEKEDVIDFETEFANVY